MGHRSKDIAQRFARIFNHKVTFDKDNATAKFTLPGFHYADFDRAGFMNIFQLHRVLKSSRIISMAHDNFCPENLADTKHRLVMIGQRMTVHAAFYSEVAMVCPLEFTDQIVALGKSSLVRKVSLRSPGSGRVLVSQWNKLVNMDMETKRSCSLDDIVRRRYESVINTDPRDVFSDIKPVQVPERHHTSERRVRHSDMDFRLHTNQSSYLLFILDAAAEAAGSDFYLRIKSDVCFYGVKAASTLYLSETHAGDDLKVYTWDNESEPSKLQFVIYKAGTAVFYGHFELLDEPLWSRLTDSDGYQI